MTPLTRNAPPGAYRGPSWQPVGEPAAAAEIGDLSRPVPCAGPPVANTGPPAADTGPPVADTGPPASGSGLVWGRWLGFISSAEVRVRSFGWLVAKTMWEN